MKTTRLLPLVGAALLAALTACSKGGEAPARSGVSVPGGPRAGTVVAEVEGRSITLAELDEKARGQLVRIRHEEFDIRSRVLEELIAERLLEAEAARRGVTLEALEREEIDGRAARHDPSLAETVYARNRDRFAGQSREKALERIREILLERSRSERRAAFQSELRAERSVVVHLEAPRVAVDIPKGAPVIGAHDAPVTIVEFTDYQCPFCHRAQSTIDQILARYEGRVRLVHLDFPLDNHPGAVPAARAARCAGEQGRFWEYHRSLMSDRGSLDESDLRKRGTALGLDTRRFARCLESLEHDEAIRADLDQGMDLGVSGTPAYFVNGRMISGAQPYETFAALVDAELAGG